MILCVYALAVSSRPVQRLTGMAGERLRAIPFDGVMAIVGDVRRRPVASTRNLRRYAAVVESIAARMPAVLPARFGTTFDDVAELTLVLRSRGATMRRRLRAVRGRTQMTIRLLGSDPSDESYRGQTPEQVDSRYAVFAAAVGGPAYGARGTRACADSAGASTVREGRARGAAR